MECWPTYESDIREMLGGGANAKMRRRNLPGDFQEEWQHGADGCGVHATGATFQNQDAFQYADWKDDTDWITV